MTSVTARYTRLLPAGVWLKLHRLSLVVLVLAWLHGVLAGTDSDGAAAALRRSFGLVVAAAAHRYWVSRRTRGIGLRPASPSGPRRGRLRVRSRPATGAGRRDVRHLPGTATIAAPTPWR